MSLANLDLYHALKAAGVNEDLATRAAESVVAPSDIQAIKESTKALHGETEAIRKEFREDIAAVRKELHEETAAIRTDLQSLDVRLSRLETRVEEGFTHLNRVVYGVVFGILLLLVRGFWSP